MSLPARLALLSFGLAAAPAGAAFAAGVSVSAETVRTVAAALTTAEMDGRAVGTAGHAKAQEYLVGFLAEHGVKPLGATPGSYLQPFAQGNNILGLVSGPDGPPRILISAHYDHLGHVCRHVPQSAAAVCNGAADDAAGVAVVLAAAEALAGRTGLPVAIALWDAEESGLLGSAYFLTAPTFDVTGLRLAIDMDIVGLDLFRGFEATHFAIGGETGGPRLQDDLRLAAAEGLDLGQLSYAFGHDRSDLTSLVDAGFQVPFVLFSDGDGSVYHSDGDDFATLNLDKVRRVADTVANLTLRAAAAEAYSYQAPFHLGQTYLPVFADASAVDAMLQRLGGTAASLTDAQRGELAAHTAKVGGVVAAGPTRFDAGAMTEVAGAARWFLSLSRTVSATGAR